MVNKQSNKGVKMTVAEIIEDDNGYYNIVITALDNIVVLECNSKKHAERLLQTIAECSTSTEIED